MNCNFCKTLLYYPNGSFIIQCTICKNLIKIIKSNQNSELPKSNSILTSNFDQNINFDRNINSINVNVNAISYSSSSSKRFSNAYMVSLLAEFDEWKTDFLDFFMKTGLNNAVLI